MKAWFYRVVLIGAAALAGYVAGGIAGTIGYLFLRQEKVPFLAERTPLPHHVPEHPGGVSFRFAMAHDVIHERFAKHGPAYYKERDRRDRERLATLPRASAEWFALADDVGTGLERLGRSDEAVAILRDKLDEQQKGGQGGRDLYTSYANLGTFLIHGSFKQAMAGDQAARERFREGVGFIRKSVEVNPEAHFGRERWQAAIAEFLLAAMNDPALLKTYDCLGNRLDPGIEEFLDRDSNWFTTGFGRAADIRFSRWEAAGEVPEFFRPGLSLDDPSRWKALSAIRGYITKVGAEEGWEGVPVPSHRTPSAFDEPVLGIIGMWRQGGGANPHFALALGETMLRVGQRYIAWTAFERASRLSDRFWPDPEIQSFLRDHCRKRQTQIEETFADRRPATGTASPPPWPQDSPPREKVTAEDLRSRFDAELKFGEDYQRRYQQYEEAKIAAGDSVFDPHAFDAFSRGARPIASPVGPEEWFVGVSDARFADYAYQRRQSWGMMGAGLAAMTTSLVLRRRSRARSPDRSGIRFIETEAEAEA